jgi:VanZ family protein
VTPTWNPTYRLALGNEVVMNRCWEGDLSAAQVHVAGRAIDLLRSPELYRPERFPLLRTIGDQFEARYLVRTAPRDAVLNFFCFIPLGWLIVLVLPGIRLGPATALGFATSLAMETLQLLCPDRYPSLVDLALNAAGTAAGFALATRFARWRARESAAA